MASIKQQLVTIAQSIYKMRIIIKIVLLVLLPITMYFLTLDIYAAGIVFAMLFSLFFLSAEEIAIFLVFIVVGMLIASLADTKELYEKAGELVFFLLVTVVIKYIVQFKKTEKPSEQ